MIETNQFDYLLYLHAYLVLSLEGDCNGSSWPEVDTTK